MSNITNLLSIDLVLLIIMLYYQISREMNITKSMIALLSYFFASFAQLVFLFRREKIETKYFYIIPAQLAKIVAIWLGVANVPENLILIFQLLLVFQDELPKTMIFAVILAQSSINTFNLNKADEMTIYQMSLLSLNAICVIQVLVQLQANKPSQQCQPSPLINSSTSQHMRRSCIQMDETLDEEPWTGYKWLHFENYIVLSRTLQMRHINFELSKYAQIQTDAVTGPEFYVEKLLELMIKTNELSSFALTKKATVFRPYLSSCVQNPNFETYFNSVQIMPGFLDLSHFAVNIFGIAGRSENFVIIHFVKAGARKDNNCLLDICRSLSHELGTCLNLIQTLSLAGLQNPDLDNEVRQEYLQPIHTNSQQLNLIISNFRDYSAVEFEWFQLSLCQFDMSNEIQEIASFFKDTCDSKNIRLILPLEQYSLFNDKERFKQVFYQIVSNAVRFTTQGQIEVTVKVLESGLLQVAVKDSGVGMTLEERHRLDRLLQFGEANRVSKNSVGASLGLFISNSILKKMNQDETSTIVFTSNQKGSNFHFNIKNMSDALDNVSKIRSQDQSRSIIRLQSIHSYYENKMAEEVLIRRLKRAQTHQRSLFSPKMRPNISFGGEEEADSIQSNDLQECQSDQVISNTLPAMEPKFQEVIQIYPLKSKCCARVLIVDDEYFNIVAMQAIMKKFSTLCDHAYHGMEALEMVQKKWEDPCVVCRNRSYQLIFLDINMPVMGGMEAVQKIKALAADWKLKKLCVIANTGFSDLETKIAAYNSGMDYFLTKPLCVRELTQILKKEFPKG